MFVVGSVCPTCRTQDAEADMYSVVEFDTASYQTPDAYDLRCVDVCHHLFRSSTHVGGRGVREWHVPGWYYVDISPSSPGGKCDDVTVRSYNA